MDRLQEFMKKSELSQEVILWIIASYTDIKLKEYYSKDDKICARAWERINDILKTL